MYNKPKPIVLVIMDGIGVAPPSSGNAVSLAKTPSLDLLWPKYPHTYLHASGQNVGLPHGVDGNSEVGHINLGAGKVVFQELPRIDNAISNGSFFKNKHLISAFNRSVNNKVHIMGLIGTGQVHSSYNHWIALLEMAEKLKANGENVFLHLFTDGRDSKPQGAKDLLERLEVEMKRTKVGSIASLIGRYNAMDRDERWERTEKAYNLLVEGKGTPVLSWEEALKLSYKQNKYDEYLEAYVVAKGGEPIAKVEEGDAVIFLNYRPDRAVQLTKAFEDENFKGFDRKIIKDLFFVGLSNYEQGFPRNIAFPPERISQSVGKVLAENRLKQLRIAESEKFPHVTYFFNGGNQVQYPGEDRIEVPSPRDIPTYDQKPEMSSFLISEVLLNKIKDDYYDVIVVNFAGPDMVAHTGVVEATVKAIEVMDECIGKIADSVIKKGGALIITADHGNAEEMVSLQTGNVDTKHSTNPVPLIIAQDGLIGRELSFGMLADVAPTILGLLGIPRAVEMTGRNLLV